MVSRLTREGGKLTLSGDPARLARAEALVNEALEGHRKGSLDSIGISELFAAAAQKPRTNNKKGATAGTGFGASVRPRGANQESYLKAINDNPVCFGIGPAGTGKTFLAVAAAVALMKSKEFRKIVLVRPAVEAGEHLGFLPGDLEAKISPYLRPLYDALEDLLSPNTLRRYMDEGIVEISPLAYMRVEP